MVSEPKNREDRKIINRELLVIEPENLGSSVVETVVPTGAVKKSIQL